MSRFPSDPEPESRSLKRLLRPVAGVVALAVLLGLAVRFWQFGGADQSAGPPRSTPVSKGVVISVDFDSRQLIVSSPDGRNVHRVGDAGSVDSITAVAPDGTQIVDSDLTIWPVTATGVGAPSTQLVDDFNGPESLAAPAIADHNRTIVTGGPGQTHNEPLTFYDAATGHRVVRPGAVGSLAADPLQAAAWVVHARGHARFIHQTVFQNDDMVRHVSAAGSTRVLITAKRAETLAGIPARTIVDMEVFPSPDGKLLAIALSPATPKLPPSTVLILRRDGRFVFRLRAVSTLTARWSPDSSAFLVDDSAGKSLEEYNQTSRSASRIDLSGNAVRYSDCVFSPDLRGLLCQGLAADGQPVNWYRFNSSTQASESGPAPGIPLLWIGSTNGSGQ